MTNKWMTQLTKSFGKAAADMPSMKDSVIPLPSPSLNWALGNGGIVEGKAICFYGGESSGKSLLAQLALIEIQKKHPEGIVAWFDAEFSFNKDWFAKLGGDLNRIVVYETNDPTKIFDFIWGDLLEMLQDGMPLKALTIDSVKSILYPGDMKDISTKITMGGSGAKYLGPALKRILPVVREFNITTCLIQQVYEELDPMKALSNPYKLPDGRALKHFCDYMIEVTKLETKKGKIEQGKNLIGSDAQIGHKVRAKCKKNRTGSPARVAEFSLRYDTGIVNQSAEIYELAKSIGIVYHPINPSTGKPNNQMWQFAEMDPVRGEPAMKKLIEKDINLQNAIEKACNSVEEDVIQNRDVESGMMDVSVDLNDL